MYGVLSDLSIITNPVQDIYVVAGMLGNNIKESLDGFREIMGIGDDAKYLDVRSEKEELEYGQYWWKKLADKEIMLTDKLLEMEKTVMEIL